MFEHVTTRAAVEFVRAARAGVAATITPQHLLLNRNALFAGGFRPHYYCLPVLKTEPDRRALLEAIASGDPALLPRHRQRSACAGGQGSACGCAGIFSAHAGIELYAEIFDAEGHTAAAARFCLASSAPTSIACRVTRSTSCCVGKPGGARQLPVR